jgi:ribosomal protein S18 acetylase RimI-like enzyme
MIVIRDFLPDKAKQVDALALQAFAQYQTAYQDWPAFQAKLGKLSALADVGELVVAEVGGQVVGAVVYIGPNAPKADFFRPEWSIMRMLVVTPEMRGRGIGRLLAEECLHRAQRDGATTVALHTSDLMQVALQMYQRMGFKLVAKAPLIHGVAYGIYVKELAADER